MFPNSSAANSSPMPTYNKRFFDNSDFTLSSVAGREGERDYIYTNIRSKHSLIENDLKDWLAVLKKNNIEDSQYLDEAREACHVLVGFYKKYKQADKAQEYIKLRTLLDAVIDNTPVDNGSQPENNTTIDWKDQLFNYWVELRDTPFNRYVSILRGVISPGNGARLALLFARLDLTMGLALLNELELLKSLEGLLGRPFDMSLLESSKGVSNALSVAFFATRLLIDASRFIQHIYIDKNSTWEHEWRERHWVMVNDFVWASVNMLSNYPTYFPYLHITGPIAMGLTAAFLVFDVAWIIYKFHCIEKIAYEDQKSRYESQRVDLPDGDPLKLLINAQLVELEIRWEATQADINCNFSAAMMLAAGLSISLLFAGSAGLMLSYLTVSVGISLYLSAETCRLWGEKASLRKHANPNTNPRILKTLDEDVIDARNVFFVSVVESTAIPLLIVGLCTISWPASLLFTALYLGSKNIKSCKQNAEQVSEGSLLPPQLVRTYH